MLEDFSVTAATLESLVSHEIGHNLSATHDSEDAGYIMQPSLGNFNDWSQASKTQINNHLSGLTFLDNCTTLGLAPEAGIEQSSSVTCVGGSVQFGDQSRFGENSNWEFFGGSPSQSTRPIESPQYDNSGLFPVRLTASNSNGSDNALSYVNVLDAPPSLCEPSGTGGTTGIEFIQLNNITNSSSIASGYEDFSCL